MRLKNVSVLSQREYTSRIRTKAFWISTLLLPALMAALVLLPALLIERTRAGQRLVVVDETGQLGRELARRLAADGEGGPARASFEVELEAPAADEAQQRRQLEQQVLDDEIDAWLWISAAGLEEDRVEYHAESVSNFLTQRVLENEISTAVRSLRLERAGLDEALIDELSRSVELETLRITEEGSRAEAGDAGFILAYLLFFLLYMTLIIYGTQVMNGVLEEKTSRVVEVVLATVSPFELMMGKLSGICLVGLTQLAIWLGTMVVLTAPGVVTGLAWLPEEQLPTVSLAVVAHFIGFFLLGYFVFATFYAAIGAAFNNVQEAQQFAGVAVIFLIAPVMLMMPVINDPGSTLAVVGSLIPVFTPLLMMLRVAVEMPPAWQLALGYLLTAAFGVFMVWLSARIYRVGILMYGKKPTLPELWRWVRYA